MIVIENKRMVGDDLCKFNLTSTNGNDEKPIGTYADYRIASGSTFVNWNTGELYCYDAPSQVWQKFGGGDT